MSVFAIIPARGGSKGIPRKNLQRVGGIPLVARSVEVALAARSIDAVYVSTDDDEIAACARSAGANVIERPAALSGDTASSEAALLHACSQWEAAGTLPDWLAFLQPTSPFLLASELDLGMERVRTSGADVGVAVAQHHRFQWQMQDDGQLSAIGHDPSRRPRRQELADRFVETGAFYILRTRGFLEAQFRFFGKVVGCEMDPSRMLEIDDPIELDTARAMARLLDAAAVAQRMPTPIDGVVFDFDGVMTDDAVYVDQEGREMVRASRRDGLGLGLLAARQLPCLVLSKERNPVVARRCEKLKLECLQGVDDKLPALKEWAQRRGVRLEHCAYVGNDINDIACMEAVGFAVAVEDADPRVKGVATWVCPARGGNGAVRQVCELLAGGPRL